MNYADTTFTDPRAAEARRLRMEEGLSSAEIRKRLDVEKGQLRYWLAGLPANDESLRARAKDDQKDAARELRRQGKTYDEIVAELGCAKSSVSLWVRDIPVQRTSPQGWTEEGRAKRDEVVRKRRERKASDRLQQQDDMSRQLERLSGRELLLTGAIAYWCEGTKVKTSTGSGRVVFTNMDPGLIRLFLRFLEAVPVEHGGPTYQIAIHESADQAVAKSHWCRELGIEMNDFQKTLLKRHNPKTVRKNLAESYHGCLVVGVRRSAKLYWYIENLAKSVMRVSEADVKADAWP